VTQAGTDLPPPPRDPQDLAGFPVRAWRAQQPLARIHQEIHAPLFFARDPGGRFNPPDPDAAWGTCSLSTMIHESSSNPFDYWPQPFQIQVFNEVTYPGSDIAGRIDNKQNFTTLQAQRFSDDTYVSFVNNVPLGASSDIPGKWKYEALAPDNLRLWEEP